MFFALVLYFPALKIHKGSFLNAHWETVTVYFMIEVHQSGNHLSDLRLVKGKFVLVLNYAT
jgi:hypothetical protein